MNQAEWAKVKSESAIGDGVEALDNMIRILERAGQEVIQAKSRLIALSSEPNMASESGYKAEDVLTSVINYAAANILGNLRLDLVAGAAVKIAKAREDIKHATQE